MLMNIEEEGFGNLICSHPERIGWRAPILLGPLERPNLDHWRLALSNGSNRMSPTLSCEKGKGSSFRNAVLHYSSEYRTMDKAQKPSGPK
jgi:hypothetical protein